MFRLSIGGFAIRLCLFGSCLDQCTIDLQGEYAKMEHLVSIIVPVYKVENVVQRCIKSITAQTYTNIEIIIVDDGSPDGSGAICDSLAQDDSRIKVFHLKNGGVSYARNFGIQKAAGDLLAFVDADDIWMPDKLQMQINLMKDKGCAFVFADYYKTSSQQDTNNAQRLIKAPLVVDYNTLLGGNVIGCLTAMYSADILGKKYFRECGHEDFLLWLSILKEGYTAYNVGKPLAFYRVGEKSLSSNKFKTILWTWHILKHEEKLPLLKALKYFSLYAVRGFVKFNK